MPWKEVQNKIKIKKQSKLAFLVLLLLGLLLILSFTIQFTRHLFSPWQTNSSRSYLWSGQFNISLVIRTRTTSLLSYNPEQQKVVLINIPDETYLEVPRGFGKWQLRSVYGLGGDQLLKETIADFFALPIDGFLDFGEIDRSGAALLDTLRQNPFSGFELLPSLKTDLTPWELIRLRLSLWSVRFDKVRTITLVNTLTKELLPDGTEVFSSDPVRIDNIVADLADPNLTSEHKTIAILNATDQPQLAQKWARLISNIGGNVIITGNARVRLGKTQLKGEDSITLKRLRQIFPASDKISDLSENIESSRAEIILLLGEDYAKQ